MFACISSNRIKTLSFSFSCLNSPSFLGHRTLFVGVRMPRQSHRHHKGHGSRHRKRDRRASSIANQQSEDDEAASSSHGSTHTHTHRNLQSVSQFCCIIFVEAHIVIHRPHGDLLARPPPTEDAVAVKQSLSILWALHTCRTSG